MSEEAWYYVDSGLRIGPISLQSLKETLVTLPDAENVLVWREGFPDWKIAGDVKELRARILTPPPLPRTHLAAPMPAWRVRWWWYPVALFFWIDWEQRGSQSNGLGHCRTSNDSDDKTKTASA